MRNSLFRLSLLVIIAISTSGCMDESKVIKKESTFCIKKEGLGIPVRDMMAIYLKYGSDVGNKMMHSKFECQTLKVNTKIKIKEKNIPCGTNVCAKVKIPSGKIGYVGMGLLNK